MRQRNPGPHPVILPTLDPPREVQEGEEIDHPELLAGFEPVDPPDPLSGATGSESDQGTPPAEAKTKTQRRRAGGDSAEEATR